MHIHTQPTLLPVKVFLGAFLASLLVISPLSFAKEFIKESNSEPISIPEVPSNCASSIHALPLKLSFQQRPSWPFWWAQQIVVSGRSTSGNNFVPNSQVILQKRVLRPYPAWQLLIQSADEMKVSVATASKDTILLASWRNSFTIRDCNNKKVAQIVEDVVTNAFQPNEPSSDDIFDKKASLKIPAFRQWKIIDLRSEKPRQVAKVAVRNVSGRLAVEIADDTNEILAKFTNWNPNPVPFGYSGNVVLDTAALDVLDPLVVLFFPVLLDPLLK